jgi:hypothetical protein
MISWFFMLRFYTDELGPVPAMGESMSIVSLLVVLVIVGLLLWAAGQIPMDAAILRIIRVVVVVAVVLWLVTSFFGMPAGFGFHGGHFC